MEMELYRPYPELLLTTIEAVYVGYDAATEATKRVPDDLRELIGHYEDTGEVLPLSRFPELVAALAHTPPGAGHRPITP